MKPVTTGIVAALLTLSPAALANDENPDLIDLSGLIIRRGIDVIRPRGLSGRE
jgi:hypothetical protein